jgi:predicted aldo/keto reductase-like oxidoreductase
MNFLGSFPNRQQAQRHAAEFLKQVAWGTCVAGLSPAILTQVSPASLEGNLPRRTLGKTGEQVSILGLGGWHLGSISDDQNAIRLVRTAVDQGVTFMDNAWEYHRGRSEEIMGRALKDGYRQKVFLMTKHHGRDKQTALQHLEDSLRRLQTEVIDLWQFHEVIYEDDPQKIFAAGGGIEAAVAAKQAGKVRYIGFTGHKDPKIFLEMLQHDYPWDTVQMPVNVMDSHFRSFQKEILPVLRQRRIGVIAMKTLGGGHLLAAGVASPKEALEYVWSQPVDTIVCGMASHDTLQTNIALARAFTPMSAEAQENLLTRTRAAAAQGKYELYKTSREFDGWLWRQLRGIV